MSLLLCRALRVILPAVVVSDSGDGVYRLDYKPELPLLISS